MCSFLCSNKQINDIEKVNHYLKLRGNDNTNVIHKDDFTFIHNLLHITGEKTIQPFIKDDIYCLYNGEIYNFQEFGDYKSDGQCLIPLYKKYGIDFIKHLDGEYAIALMDFKLNRLIISTDLFSTKPLFIGVNYKENQFGICSYYRPLETIGFDYIEKIRANNTMYSLNDFCTYHTRPVYNWDLRQEKTRYHEWINAFEKSITKRTQNVGDRLFMGLSSGYDTGAILCELLKQNVNFKSYTIMGTAENLGHMQKRWKMIKDKKSLDWDDDIMKESQEYITNHIEQYKYKVHSTARDYNEFGVELKDDSGAFKLAYLCKFVSQDKKKIGLSGMGADEIFSDYSVKLGTPYYDHSNFGRRFPEDLHTMFPWASFNGSTMESYLMKDEYIAGSYNLEMRYPFLDKAVVQEFLWLTPELKNQFYKAPLHYYMKSNNFPFSCNEKVGF